METGNKSTSDALPGRSTRIAMVSIYFSPAERSVLRAIQTYKSQKEAARALGVSHRTIEAHTYNIRRRLGVSTTVEAIGLWREKESIVDG